MGQTEVPSIDDIYKDLLKNFDDSNEQALVLLQKKFDDNSKLMDRRCSEIVMQTKEELSKVKKLSEEDFDKIKRDIEDILFLAKYI